MIGFEWDSRKARENLRSHGVSFQEARSVFYDDYAIQFYDDDHSKGEDRFLMLGLSDLTRMLIVVHAVRGESDIIRIISARKATRDEQAHYKGPEL